MPELQQRSAGCRRSAHRPDIPRGVAVGTSAEQVEQWLSASGFTKVQAEREELGPTPAPLVSRPKQASTPSGPTASGAGQRREGDRVRANRRPSRWRSSAAMGG